MLRLKKAIDECGIQQKALVAATGFGKTQISLTLNSGKLPADAEKFKNGVFALVTDENGLAEWLATNNLNASALFDNVAFPDTTPVTSSAWENPPLRAVLYRIVGQAVLDAPAEVNSNVVRMAHAILYLQDTLAGLVGEDAPYVMNTEGEVAEILMDGAT